MIDSLLKSRAEILVEHLKLARQKGTVTYKKPIAASRLVKVYNAEPYRWDISGADIRAMVHEAREHHPIGSNGNGYWYVLFATEFLEVERHLHSRAMKILEAESNIKKQRLNMDKRLNTVFGNEILT